MTAHQTRRRADWVYATLPIALATGPLGTMVQLYLIQINGVDLGTIYGSLAGAIFNGVSIPAALFWGLATDRLHKRKALIAMSYALMSIVLVTFYFDNSTAGTILRYSAFSFVSVASATPVNLLIMETEKKDKWAATFARLSMISSVGNVLGLVLSTVWAEALPLIELSIPLGAFALASAILALATVPEPPFILEKETVALRKPSFYSRLLAIPVFFVTIPRASDFRRAFRGVRSSLTSFLPLFYMSTILFYFASGLFNTSFVPSMSKFYLSTVEIFGVILAGMVVQTISFQFAGKFVSNLSLATASVQGLLLRGWSYVAIGATALFFSGPLFLGSVLILYPLASGIAFAIYYTASNTMMFNSVQRHHAGAALGVYSAAVGLAAMAGSLLSGFVSVYLGFYTTFVLAGILMFAAVAFIAKLPKPATPDMGPQK